MNSRGGALQRLRRRIARLREPRKQVLIRMPADLRERLKDGVGEMSMNDFIIGAIEEKLAKIEPETKSRAFPDVKETAAKWFRWKYLQLKIADLKAKGKDVSTLTNEMLSVKKEVFSDLNIEAPGDRSAKARASKKWHLKYHAEIERLTKGKIWDEIRLQDISDDGTHVK